LEIGRVPACSDGTRDVVGLERVGIEGLFLVLQEGDFAGDAEVDKSLAGLAVVAELLGDHFELKEGE
jgi:hypothetical protein